MNMVIFMKKKEDLRIRKTKANLYKGLLELMKEKSFEDIKVIDICNISLINRSTFYDHFNDKFELLTSLMDEAKEELIDHLNKSKSVEVNSIKEYFMLIVKDLFAYINKNIDVYSILSIVKKNNNSIAHDMMFSAANAAVIEELREHAINHSNIPIETISLFYVSGAISVITNYSTDLNKFNEEKLLEELNKLVPDLDYLELKK